MTASEREAVLRPLRNRIDEIDDRLVAILAERIACVDEVLEIKQAHALPARMEARVEEVVARVREKAERLGAPPDLADIIWRTMIEWIITYEQRGLPGPDAASSPGEKP